MSAGLIEYSNYCKNNCLYCGIRAGNQNASRYRLSTGDILSCCQSGYSLGFRTFVLQGGEDPFMTEDKITELVSMIRREFPDCAITLSLGEMEYESYKRFFDAGADRYLLRHETANAEHYQKLHPTEMSFEHRMNCLRTLKEIGYQDRLRFYGRLPIPDIGMSRRGHDLYPRSQTGNGWDRAVYPAATRRLETRLQDPWNSPCL